MSPRNCLRSLLASDYSRVELLVVDNGSTDGSAEYLRSQFETVTVLCSKENLGFAAGSNRGIEHAMRKGANYVLLLNNDTVVSPTCVSALVSAAEGRPDYAALGPKIYYFDVPDRFWYAGGSYSHWRGVPRHRGRKQADTGQYESFCEVTFISGCALLLRSSVVTRIGMLDETLFSYVEDTDYCIRLRMGGLRLGYVPEAKVWHMEGYSALKNRSQAFRYYLYIQNSLRCPEEIRSSLPAIHDLPVFLR